MPPAARERFLQNDERFRDMSPQQRQLLRNHFQQWNQLTPAQRDRVLHNAEVWQRLSPEQRLHIRNDVLPRWQALPPDRRQAIQGRLNVLQNMPEAARNQRLNNPEFMKGLRPEDQSMLRDLSRLHVSGSPEPPPH